MNKTSIIKLLKLLEPETIPESTRALKLLLNGKKLTHAQQDLMVEFLSALLPIILDSSIYSKVLNISNANKKSIAQDIKDNISSSERLALNMKGI